MTSALYFDGRSARLHPASLRVDGGLLHIAAAGIERSVPLDRRAPGRTLRARRRWCCAWTRDGASCEVPAGPERQALLDALGYRTSRGRALAGALAGGPGCAGAADRPAGPGLLQGHPGRHRTRGRRAAAGGRGQARPCRAGRPRGARPAGALAPVGPAHRRGASAAARGAAGASAHADPADRARFAATGRQRPGPARRHHRRHRRAGAPAVDVATTT